METCNLHIYTVTMGLFKVERETGGGVGARVGEGETWAGVGWRVEGEGRERDGGGGGREVGKEREIGRDVLFLSPFFKKCVFGSTL